ncbi:acyl-CoA dehydrogenase [Pseudomonas nicosulfuronedens]|uniref:Acyl-CoA dehydrogenase n=1 Tax=Pseudomonas nicosulfuronedens TaxID=2571105 RepID=A0A5R9RID1_9PSED|nr:acyl-CoA dehydrogenase [Pseudomonas nicosulfuronedens]MDH1008372.1 acyl-CoA dehydrogenase [Pseudomonas nicosulfuronedens]MDH1979330.1 acyl-CoA dehydrogenase [Pseudomonas nicosulfuronedens]MDH2027222.1 acyl-CoA dehydrogenase [Pseudomonas nicosulfuronedens]TLX74872.1 acyl-CoA dehydrogenase [Pseudomonas nicosulfuronedens]
MTVLQSLPVALGQLPEVTRKLAEGADALDRSGEFPHANLALLQQHGLLGLALPPALGGPGASLGELRQAVGAVARGEPSTALVLCMQYLHLRRLADNPAWPEALKQRVAHEALEQGALINSLRVEPELGSPARGGLPQTVARRVGDGWRLSGHKLYTTGIPGLTWLAVWARSDEPTPRVGSWLVRRDSPGIRIVESWDHLGMRATGSHEVIFEDVPVPLQHAVGLYPHDQPPAPDEAVARDFAQASAALLGALYDGVAHAARDWLVQWLRERVPASLGSPLASLPRVQEAVGGIDQLLLQNRLLLDAACRDWLSASESGLIKVSVTDNAIAVVEKALELTGNHGLSRHNPLQRHYRDVLCGRVHTPQKDSVWIAAGRAALSA